MRELFPGYYKPTEEEFADLWKQCVFAFDANVLLNIYRYSPDTRETFLEILKRLEDQIWLPHQAALEYQENRLNVLSAQLKAYEDVPKSVESALQEIKSSYPRHPFIPLHEVTATLQKTVDQIKQSLDRARAAHPDLTHEDELRDALTNLFHGKVGQPYSEDNLHRIYEEGEKRYQKQLPPGFSDSKKESNRKYGDLILWNQLKDFCKTEKRPLILITDDKKEDWWQVHKGNTIGPRPELVQEMRAEAGTKFYMYQSDRFIEYAQKLFNLGADKAVEEVREVSRESDWTLPSSLKLQLPLQSEWLKFRKRRYSRMQVLSALEINNKEENTAALQYISQSPRTFPELRKFFKDDSRLARTVLQHFLATGILETHPDNPNRFSLSQFGKRVERLLNDIKDSETYDISDPE